MFNSYTKAIIKRLWESYNLFNCFGVWIDVRVMYSALVLMFNIFAISGPGQKKTGWGLIALIQERAWVHDTFQPKTETRSRRFAYTRAVASTRFSNYLSFEKILNKSIYLW